MSQKVDWYSRGRDAFTEGRPCFIKDARISAADRTSWYAGWNHQSRVNGLAKMSEQDRAALSDAFGEILAAVRSQP